MKIRLPLAAAAMIAVTAMPAKADIIISSPQIIDLGATGFGNAPRLLTIQRNDFEAGGTFFTGTGASGSAAATGYTQGAPGTLLPPTVCDSNGGCNLGGTVTQIAKGAVFSVASLGWFTGSQVGIGLDTNESGSNHPLTFDTLRLTLYSSTGAVLGTFNGNGPVDISVAQLDTQQGNGNSVFNFILDAPQQAQYNAILAANGGAANVYEGLQASFGCGAFAPAVCNGGQPFQWGSTDGAESFLAFVAPGPIVGAGFPGMMAALLGMVGLNRYRRRRTP